MSGVNERLNMLLGASVVTNEMVLKELERGPNRMLLEVFRLRQAEKNRNGQLYMPVEFFSDWTKMSEDDKREFLYYALYLDY